GFERPRWFAKDGVAQEDHYSFRRTAVDDLVAAIEADPTYPDPFCFLGIIQYRFVGDASTARPLIDGCLAADPPGEVRGLVEGLAAELADLSD
ncbi:MAG: hypothetical protein ACPGSH_04060, partial [Ilumatobacteraceae bacterium]